MKTKETSILQEIVDYKRKIVAIDSKQTPLFRLERSEYFHREVYSLKKGLLAERNHGIIAEFKRKSPSKGLINGKLNIEEVVCGYEQAGASAVSVLTDNKYFGGSSVDFQIARDNLKLPLLRKDFIVDEYQVYQTKAMGADLMLLIAAALTRQEQLKLAKIAQSIGLEVLLELHSAEEIIEEVLEHVDIVGVNNRNLKTFETTIKNSIELAEVLPGSMVKISESGISTVNDIKKLVRYDYKGFLIGEQFMKHDKPQEELKKFIKS